MKKIMAVMLLLLACTVLLAGCNTSSESNEEQSLKVYSFSGENEYISVSNGVIILDGKDEICYGGDLKVMSDDFANITTYSTTIYINGSEKETLLSNGVDDQTGHDETDTQTLIETQPPVSSVLFRQDGADIQQSTDEGKTWQSYSPIEETDYFTYDEFSAWIENETENIQKLVDAGEWTETEATEALEYYDEILKSILEGKMVGKRASSSDDQLFFSMPDNAQPEQYQTFVFDGNTYKSIGPFDTEEELFNALKEYTDTEVEAGTMTQAEATALLEKYQ